ncbi:MAG: hypothetical protein HYV07_06645 [Deltaproteobacteria bacterium]|nr:hypothetical protein [Deltaproteobacteria bacterium]
MNWKEKLETELSELETLRDELRLQAHLGKVEAKAQWEKAESTWAEVRRRLLELESVSGDAAKEVGRAAKGLLDEIRAGYDKMAG